MYYGSSFSIVLYARLAIALIFVVQNQAVDCAKSINESYVAHHISQSLYSFI